jgi:hypothetical protein
VAHVLGAQGGAPDEEERVERLDGPLDFRLADTIRGETSLARAVEEKLLVDRLVAHADRE